MAWWKIADVLKREGDFIIYDGGGVLWACFSDDEPPLLGAPVDCPLQKPVNEVGSEDGEEDFVVGHYWHDGSKFNKGLYKEISILPSRS